MTVAEVTTLHASNFRDVAKTLRVIAEDVEAGKYGEVQCAGIVLMGNQVEVFGAGPASDAASVAMLLHAGFDSMSKMIYPIPA